MSKEYLPIVNLHTCIQGEGKSTGQPMILIRMTKCNLNCAFKDSICDSSETSWLHDPLSGKYTERDIEELIAENPQIKKVMITGGQPTYQPMEFIRIAQIAQRNGLQIEVEDNGTTFGYNLLPYIDLITISPKLSNSTPVPGVFISELGRSLTESDRDKHEKGRKNYRSIRSWIANANDYQLKFVISDEEDIAEAMEVLNKVVARWDKVYFMPEGATRDQLESRRKWLYERCIELGINYTDRLHILVYNDKKGV